MGLIEAVLEDHEEVKALFSQIDRADPKERAELFATLRAELVRHEVAEQEIVHPLTGERVRDGEETRRDLVAEERGAERILNDMDDAESGTQEWDGLLGRLRAAVLTHAEMEESIELPQLRQRVDDDELERKGTMFEAAKKLVPARPQPDAPTGRVADLAQEPIPALVAAARDAVHKAMAT